MRILYQSPLEGSVAFVCALVCTVALQSQIVPHPYLSVERKERLINDLISDGSLRRAEDILRSIQTSRIAAASDAVARRQAEVQYGSGLYVLADRTQQRFVEGRPNSPDVPFVIAERGFAALEQQEWPEAAGYLLDASEQARINWQLRTQQEYKDLAHLSLFWCGVSRAKAGLFAEALQAFTQCTAVDTVGEYADRALFVVGQLYEQNGNLDDAMAAYKDIRLRHPKSKVVVASRIREAQLYLRQNAPERAIDVLVGIELQLQPGRDSAVLPQQYYAEHALEEVTMLRISSMIHRGRYADAYAASQKFIETNSASSYLALVQLHAGFAALYIDSANAALLLLDSVLAHPTPSSPEVRQQALLYHAIALRRVGKVEEAGEEFADLSSQSDYPYQAQALVELGQGAYVRADYDGARKILERAERASADPSTTERARLLLGAVYVEKQEWGKAADAYERAEQLALTATDQFLKNKNRYLAEARLKRGICLLQDNERAAAIRVLTDYLGNHPADVQRDEGTFWLAEAMYRNDLLRNAQDLYEEVVNRYTASIRREEAMYGLAWTYFRRRDFDKSVRLFSQLLSAYPKSRYSTDALVRKGDGLYITRRYSDAAQQYEEAYKRSPASDEGLYAGFQAGQALYRAGNLHGATAQLNSYATAHGSSKLADDALYLSGWIAFQQNNDAGAIETFSRLLKSYPNGDQAVRAMYTMADARYNLGDMQGAIDTYKQIVERYPNNPLAIDAGKSMQTALIGEGRSEEALAIADSWINANPTGPVAQEFAWEKANIFYTGRNYKNAADEYQAFLAKYPQGDRTDDALYNLGKSYLSMDDLPQALVAFTDLQKRFPASNYVAGSKLDIADYHRDQARARSADSIYAIVQTQFVNDTPNASRAGFERATIARQLLDTTKAITQYRITADRYAGSEFGDQARYQLSLYYRGKKLLDSARTELAILIRTSQNATIRANALYDMGDTFARERRWEDAAALFERVRQEYAGYEDWFTLSMIGLGSCYEQLEQIDKAKAAYGVVAQIRPDDDYGKTAIARLKRLERK